MNEKSERNNSLVELDNFLRKNCSRFFEFSRLYFKRKDPSNEKKAHFVWNGSVKKFMHGGKGHGRREKSRANNNEKETGDTGNALKT